MLSLAARRTSRRAAPTLRRALLTRRAAPPRMHIQKLSTTAPQTKNVALRLALAPYAALSIFPMASGAAALYHSINGITHHHHHHHYIQPSQTARHQANIV